MIRPILSLLAVSVILLSPNCVASPNSKAPSGKSEQKASEPIEGEFSRVSIETDPIEAECGPSGATLNCAFRISDLINRQPVRLPSDMFKHHNSQNASSNPVWAPATEPDRSKDPRELYWLKRLSIEAVDEHDKLQPAAIAGTLTIEVDPDFRDRIFPEGERCLERTLVNLKDGRTEFLLPTGFAIPTASDELWKFNFNMINRSDKTQKAKLRCKLDFIKDRSLVYPVTPLYWLPPDKLGSSKTVQGNFVADYNFARPEWKSEPVEPAPFCGVTPIGTASNTSDSEARMESAIKKLPHDSDQYPLFDQDRDGPLLKESKHVELKTTAGSITMVIDPKLAPDSATQIFRLLTKGAYNGTPLFRYEPNFVIQAANAEEKVAGANPMPSDVRALLRRLPLESKAQESGQVIHKPFVLSLGRWDDDPDSAVSSFSMIIGNAPHLDGKYTIFGHLETDEATTATIERIKRQWPTKPSIVMAKEI